MPHKKGITFDKINGPNVLKKKVGHNKYRSMPHLESQCLFTFKVKKLRFRDQKKKKRSYDRDSIPNA